MDETQNAIAYSPKQLAEILVKHNDIHDGHWGIQIEFNFAAGMIPVASQDKSAVVVLPAAINAVGKIGLRRFEEANPITVNASEVNPLVLLEQPRQRHAKEKEG